MSYYDRMKVNQILKAGNPYHDDKGRFTHGSGASESPSKGGGKGKKVRNLDDTAYAPEVVADGAINRINSELGSEVLKRADANAIADKFREAYASNSALAKELDKAQTVDFAHHYVHQMAVSYLQEKNPKSYMKLMGKRAKESLKTRSGA